MEERRFSAASRMEEMSGFSPGGATGPKGRVCGRANAALKGPLFHNTAIARRSRES